MIQAGTTTSRIAGPPSSGKSVCLFRAATSGVPVEQARPSPITVENPSAAGRDPVPGSRKYGSGPLASIEWARNSVVPW
jgi:hypothetical protein